MNDLFQSQVYQVVPALASECFETDRELLDMHCLFALATWDIDKGELEGLHPKPHSRFQVDR